ncbi:hypothetical protein VULLAG_LOCUS8540 [Vulpes lagopus]
MHNTRGNYSVLPGNGSSWQEGCRRGWKEFSRKFTTKPDGEGTGLAVWTSHRQTDGVLVHLRCPSPGGRVEEVALWEDEEEAQLVEGKRPGQLLACSEASISGNSMASGAAFPAGLDVPARWGASSRPNTKHCWAGEAAFADGLQGIRFQERGSSKCWKAEFLTFLLCLGPA